MHLLYGHISKCVEGYTLASTVLRSNYTHTHIHKHTHTHTYTYMQSWHTHAYLRLRKLKCNLQTTGSRQGKTCGMFWTRKENIPAFVKASPKVISGLPAELRFEVASRMTVPLFCFHSCITINTLMCAYVCMCVCVYLYISISISIYIYIYMGKGSSAWFHGDVG